ncbi:hypothetical protein Taro_039598, partial [Colocasia esculenta]|nr:hypothetical protein [Colocasia esculenta]
MVDGNGVGDEIGLELMVEWEEWVCERGKRELGAWVLRSLLPLTAQAHSPMDWNLAQMALMALHPEHLALLALHLEHLALLALHLEHLALLALHFLMLLLLLESQKEGNGQSCGSAGAKRHRCTAPRAQGRTRWSVRQRWAPSAPASVPDGARCIAPGGALRTAPKCSGAAALPVRQRRVPACLGAYAPGHTHAWRASPFLCGTGLQAPKQCPEKGNLTWVPFADSPTAVARRRGEGVGGPSSCRWLVRPLPPVGEATASPPPLAALAACTRRRRLGLLAGTYSRRRDPTLLAPAAVAAYAPPLPWLPRHRATIVAPLLLHACRRRPGCPTTGRREEGGWRPRKVTLPLALFRTEPNQERSNRKKEGKNGKKKKKGRLKCKHTIEKLHKTP